MHVGVWEMLIGRCQIGWPLAKTILSFSTLSLALLLHVFGTGIAWHQRSPPHSGYIEQLQWSRCRASNAVACNTGTAGFDRHVDYPGTWVEWLFSQDVYKTATLSALVEISFVYTIQKTAHYTALIAS